MRIQASFHFSDGRIQTEEIVEYRPLEDVKKDLAYVEYDSHNFEWVMYDSAGAYSYFDYTASFVEIRYSLGRPFPVIQVSGGNNISFGRDCECGSIKVGSDRHSHWCPKYTTQ